MYCLHSNSYHYFSIEDAINSAKRAGFKGLEIAAVKGWTEHIMPSFSKQRITEIQQMAQDSGVEIRVMSGHCDLRNPDRLKDFIENIRLANNLGCHTVVTSSGEAHFGNEMVDCEDLLISGLEKSLEECEKTNMTLAIETHGQYGSGERIAELIDRIGHPLLGIAYDTANVIRHGDVMPEDDIIKCSKYIKHVHLKDKTGEKYGRTFTALGSGWICFDKIFRELDRVGYAGDFSYEVEYFDDIEPELSQVDKDVYDSVVWLKQQGRMS